MKKHSKVDTFKVHGDVETTLNKVAEHLQSRRMKPKRIDGIVQVHAGSDLMFRLWGAAIPWGAKNIPTGLDVHAVPDGEYTVVTSYAYDRLGWYATDALFWGADRILENKLTALVASVRTALADADPEPQYRPVTVTSPAPTSCEQACSPGPAPSNKGPAAYGAEVPYGNASTFIPPEPFYRAPTNALAIAALASSLFGIALLGIILGHMALNKIKATGESGRGMAIAGLTLGYLVTAVSIVIFAWAFAPDLSSSGY